MSWLKTVLLFLSSIYLTSSYKILFINPIPAQSHLILGEAFVKHLCEAGHEVTYITAVAPKKNRTGMIVVDISNNVDPINNDGVMNIQNAMGNNFWNEFLTLTPMMLNLSRTFIEHPNTQKLLSDQNEYFDVVISEWLYLDVFAGFSGIFNCPLIWFSTLEPHWLLLQLIDDIPNPAYNVHITSHNALPLTFTQRILELFNQVAIKMYQSFYIFEIERKNFELFILPHIRNRGHPDLTLDELRYNASLILSNSHVSFGTASRLPSNFIPIGGYHIDQNVKPLPENIQNIMDNANHGVIYFSMGSNLRSKHFPYRIRQSILEIFGKLNQTILWKFEEDLSNKPYNVYISKWFPQQSILAHDNCVLFITHGGLLSTMEAVHFGVPIIGIPIFADQFANVERSIRKGFAKRVDLSFSMAGELILAIQEMLNDSSYKKKAKELSMIYHHRSVHPSKDLVHWVEHVVKTGGARHLRSPAFLMPWYQKLYLDLVVVLLILIVVVKYIYNYRRNILLSLNSANLKKKQS